MNEDKEDERITFILNLNLTVGIDYSLHIEFEGALNDSLKGW